jgi:hypothetical protein
MRIASHCTVEKVAVQRQLDEDGIMDRVDVPRESFRTCVSLLPRKGVCSCFRSSARITSLSASSDVLISAPSKRVACRGHT